MKAYVNEVKEPFIFTAPVTKIAGLLSLTPGTTKKSGTFSYTVTSFKMTPLTMQLQLSYKGDFPAPVQKNRAGCCMTLQMKKRERVLRS
ncbi:hypothetical protein ACFTAO_14180 [Paenibacillus rhizoplanae]